MKRRFGALLSVVLFACGGAQSGTSASPDEAGSEASGASDRASAADDGAGDDDGAIDDEPNGDDEGAGDDDGRDQDEDGDGEGRRDAGEFAVGKADKSSRPTQAKLKATESEAAIRFFVVNKKKGPVKGIVISLTSPSGKTFYTPETDKDGFAEVLAPAGQTYELVFLSLGRRDVAARVDVADKPRLNLKLTLRYEREEYPTGGPGLVLENVRFESGRATLTPDSHARLDPVVEYMTHKKSVKIEISGHTDNVGNRRANKRLSQRRANAVRDYLVSKGISGDRIKAVGYGDEKPVAPNNTAAGRQKNRRIEAVEL